MHHSFVSFFAISFLMFLTHPVMAETPERYTNVQIISERNTIQPNDTITIATQINLAPHWHVYWQNPGDSGLPVKITWDTPDGFLFDDIQWPTPDKISYDILANYGYYDQTTLLQTLKIPENLPEGILHLTATIDMLVCNEICIPETSTVSIALNNLETPDTDHTAQITEAKNKMPPSINGAFTYDEADGNLLMTLTPEIPEILKGVSPETLEFFPFDWGIINLIANPEARFENGTLTLKHQRGDQPLSDSGKLSGLLVIKGTIGQNKGYIITATTEKKTNESAVNVPAQHLIPPEAAQEQGTTWLGALYLALFGGIILNLMPCVFPVLSIKALSLVKMGEKNHKQARKHGIAYTLGVILSFLAIGGLLLGLKEAGSLIGWGFQLQNPIVVAIIAYLLFIIGLNLIGFFEIHFKFGNFGSTLTQKQSLSGSFFTGTLATIVATPCTAPFMGAAMGFALTQPPFVGLSIFAALGFGLALPYLFLSFIPQARKILPRPGAWMNTFKQFLAFPMFASAIWLIWVLNQQSGSYGVLLTLLGMLAIAFSVWLSHLKKKNTTSTIIHTLMYLSLILPLLSLFYIKTTEDIQPSAEKTYSFGQAYTPETLSELLAGDDPVFVEMTAAWCITCKLNHAIAMNTASTKTLFEKTPVHYLIGDWTNHDDAITKYLDTFGRNGVPLYVFYGARNQITKTRPKAKILPQVLTQSIVQDTITHSDF